MPPMLVADVAKRLEFNVNNVVNVAGIAIAAQGVMSAMELDHAETQIIIGVAMMLIANTVLI